MVKWKFLGNFFSSLYFAKINLLKVKIIGSRIKIGGRVFFSLPKTPFLLKFR